MNEEYIYQDTIIYTMDSGYFVGFIFLLVICFGVYFIIDDFFKSRTGRSLKKNAKTMAGVGKIVGKGAVDIGKIIGKAAIDKVSDKLDNRSQRSKLQKQLLQIDRKLDSYKKMEETGTMSKAERNEWKELAKERLILSETLEDYED